MLASHAALPLTRCPGLPSPLLPAAALVSAALALALLARFTAPRVTMAGSVEAAARKYFDVWNAHDVPALTALFAPDATLRDWDI